MIIMTDEQLRVWVARMHLDPYCSSSHEFLGVVDANSLLSCVGYDCRQGRYGRSGMLRMADRRIATLYAPDHVYGEVYEHLPKIARWSKVPERDLRARFEGQYLSALRFVTVDTADVVDPQVLAITDLDDVPTGQLAKLIAPCVVLSEDKHLRKPGLAPDDWRLVTRCAIDLIEAASRQQMASNAARGLSVPLSGAIELIKFVSRRTGIPGWVLGLLAGGGITYALWTPERRQAVNKYVLPVLEAYSKEISESTAQERRGLAGLREVLLPAPVAPTVKQQAAIVLARQQEPLSAREIQEHMLSHFSGGLVPTLGEVRAVLKDGPEFVQPERYRWQFGRSTGPWRTV